nr:hypothetical protein CFP56_11085 [Quercus suber]
MDSKIVALVSDAFCFDEANGHDTAKLRSISRPGPFLSAPLDTSLILHGIRTQKLTTYQTRDETGQPPSEPSEVQHKFDLKGLPPEIRSLVYRMALAHQAPKLCKSKPIQIENRDEWWSNGNFTSALIRRFARGCTCTHELRAGHACHPLAVMQLDRTTRDEARFVCAQVIGEKLNFLLNCESATKLLISAAFVKRASGAMLRSLPYILFKVSNEVDASKWEISVWPRRLRFPAWYEYEYELTAQALAEAQDQADWITMLLAKVKVDTNRRRVISKMCMMDILDILAYEKGFALLTHDVSEHEEGSSPAVSDY